MKFSLIYKNRLYMVFRDINRLQKTKGFTTQPVTGHDVELSYHTNVK